MARGYIVDSEVLCPGIQQPPVGDKKRLDFVASLKTLTLAIEVKWAKKRTADIASDVHKLDACLKVHPQWRGFMCVFGWESVVANLRLPGHFKESGRIVVAHFGKTRFACRVFEYHCKESQDQLKLR